MTVKTKNAVIKGFEYALVAIVPMIAVYLGTVAGPIVGKLV